MEREIWKVCRVSINLLQIIRDSALTISPTYLKELQEFHKVSIHLSILTYCVGHAQYCC